MCIWKKDVMFSLSFWNTWEYSHALDGIRRLHITNNSSFNVWSFRCFLRPNEDSSCPKSYGKWFTSFTFHLGKISGISPKLVVLAPLLVNGEKWTYVQGESFNAKRKVYGKSCSVSSLALIVVHNQNLNR